MVGYFTSKYIMNKKLERMLENSNMISNNDKRLSIFFGKCAMGRLLDVFLNNPNKKIHIDPIIFIGDLSPKIMVDQMPFLRENNIILEEEQGHYKFYKLNKANPLVKQISKFRDILVIDNNHASTDKKQQSENNRQINPKLSKKRTTRKSKDAGGVVQV